MKRTGASSRPTWSDRLGRSSIADSVYASILELGHVDDSIKGERCSAAVLLHFRPVRRDHIFSIRSTYPVCGR
jgi:hypothetical protein